MKWDRPKNNGHMRDCRCPLPLSHHAWLAESAHHCRTTNTSMSSFCHWNVSFTVHFLKHLTSLELKQTRKQNNAFWTLWQESIKLFCWQKIDGFSTKWGHWQWKLNQSDEWCQLFLSFSMISVFWIARWIVILLFCIGKRVLILCGVVAHCVWWSNPTGSKNTPLLVGILSGCICFKLVPPALLNRFVHHNETFWMQLQ